MTEYEERDAEGDHRSEAVDDSCECCVNSGFTEGEQRERDAVQKEGEYKEMTPRCPIIRAPDMVIAMRSLEGG